MDRQLVTNVRADNSHRQVAEVIDIRAGATCTLRLDSGRLLDARDKRLAQVVRPGMVVLADEHYSVVLSGGIWPVSFSEPDTAQP